MYTEASHGAKKETQYTETCSIQQGPEQQTEIKAVFPKEACGFPQNWDVYFPGLPLKFSVECWKQIQNFSLCQCHLPVTPPTTLLLTPTAPQDKQEEHTSCCHKTRTAALPQPHSAETTADSRVRILLRPAPLWGWSHPFILPSPAILCLMQFDAAIKIDDPQPPSPAQWTLVGRAQSLCSAAAHGQVLQGLCFSSFSYCCCDLQAKTSGFKYTFLITKLPAPAFG